MSLRGSLHRPAGLPWKVGNSLLSASPLPVLMGIVNTTPDSFFDGGKHDSPEAAYAHALRLLDEGALILDIGGESTRPGSSPVDAATEIARVLPVVKALQGELSRRAFYISIDTVKAEVALECMKAGAHIVNDISALDFDPLMAQTVRDTEASIVLNHMQGSPLTMQLSPSYEDVLSEVKASLKSKVRQLEELGVDPLRICLDPGICFGKRLSDNLELVAGVDEMLPLGYPVLMGMSRKSFIGRTPGLENSDRLVPSLISAAVASLGGASVIRVHDVKATREALLMLEALLPC